ncbi:12210_t:CDS:2, partial [Acaulospora colombiana]
ITFAFIYPPASAVTLARRGTDDSIGLESSPYHIVSSNLCDPNVKQINPYSWNNASNLLFVDQPIDVGYSFGKGIANSTVEIVAPLYTFLQLFLVRFPEYSKQDFHFFGESFAGHYVSATAKYICDMNQLILEKKEEGIAINLQSVGIGNADIDAASYPTFARYSSYGQLVSSDVIGQMESYLPKCKELLDKCDVTNNDTDCASGFNYCNLYILGTFDANSGLNDYDVRLPNTTDEVPNDFVNYINHTNVKEAIGAKGEEALRTTSVIS